MMAMVAVCVAGGARRVLAWCVVYDMNSHKHLCGHVIWTPFWHDLEKPKRVRREAF